MSSHPARNTDEPLQTTDNIPPLVNIEVQNGVNPNNNPLTAESILRNIQGNPNAIPAELERSLNTQITNLSSRVKFAIPLLSLVLIKYLIDNIVSFGFAGFVLYNYEKVKAMLQTQLALKERSDVKVLTSIMVSCVGLLNIIFFSLDYLNYSQHLLGRLLFSNVSKHSIESNLYQLIWDCFITDLVVQIFITLIKSIMSVVLDQKHHLLEFIRQIPALG